MSQRAAETSPARETKSAPVIVWFRRDLRLKDNGAFAAAIVSGRPIVPVYVLDDEAEGKWREGSASRWWLHHSLTALADDLAERGSQLVLRRGAAARELQRLAEETGAKTLYWSFRYEPAGVRQQRDVEA